MTAHPEIVPSVVDRIKQTMVALKMPRAIEILDATAQFRRFRSAVPADPDQSFRSIPIRLA
jgi:hypothetical protein